MIFSTPECGQSAVNRSKIDEIQVLCFWRCFGSPNGGQRQQKASSKKRQKNDEGYFPRKGWGFNLLFQPENDEEKKLLYEYQWTYSPAPNFISYLITPLWPNKVEPDSIWEKIKDGKLYSNTISDYQEDLKSKMQAKAKENQEQRKALEQFVPEKVNEVLPQENYDGLFSGEDLPTHEELQAEFNVDDD